MLPSDFFRRNVVLSFQEDAIGIRLRDVIGVDNMMWGSDYPHSESTFPQSRQILAEILAGVLAGIELGAWDRRILQWMAGWDACTVLTVASWIARSRAAGTPR